MSLIKELRRRNVFRVGAAYLAGAWLLVQLIRELFPLFGVDDSVSRIVVIVLAIGFIPALVISWVFEWTPKGIKRDAGEEYESPATKLQTRLFDRLIIVVLSLAVAFFAVHSFIIDPMRDAENLQNARVNSFGDKSVAILPCTDLSEHGDQQYFADGIAEELLNVLSRTPELRVPARTSAFSFRDGNATINEIAERLNVAHVLECSVRRTGQQLRITAQLIEAVTDTRMWTQSYDREMGDLFAIQDDIAGQVVDRLEVTILGARPHVDQTTPEIFELSALANFILDDRKFEQKQERLEEIRERLEQAIVDDPDYFPIREQLSRVYVQLIFGSPADRQELDTLRDELNLTTYERFPNKPEAIALYMGWRLQYGFYEEAAPEIQRAHELDPDNLRTLRSTAYAALTLHRPLLAVEIQEYVVSRDPVCAECRNSLISAYVAAEEYKKARSLYEESTALGLTLGFQGRGHYARTLLALGDFEGALEAFQVFEEQTGFLPLGSGVAKFFLGRKDEYEKDLAHMKETLGEIHPLIATFYVETDQLDLAFEIFDKMTQFDRDFFDHLPYFRKLHQDPRWQEVAERAGIWRDPGDEIVFEISVPEIRDQSKL